MNFKKYLVGISILLTSAAAFAQPNAITVNGNLMNYATPSGSQFNYIKAQISPSDRSDSAYITIAGGSIAPNETFKIFITPPDTLSQIPYSMKASEMKNVVNIWLYDPNSGQTCGWTFDPNTLKTIPSSSNPSVCRVANAYDYMIYQSRI